MGLADELEELERKVMREVTIPIGDYMLELIGSNAIVFDKNGNPIWAIKAESLAGYRVKKDLAKKLKLDEAIVDKAIAEFCILTQEGNEKEEVRKIEEGLKAIETTLSKEDLNNEAIKLLKSIDLLYRVKGIYDKGVMIDRYRFVLGEDDKKLLTFIICASAKSSWAQSLWVTGTSGFGKTNMVVVTLKLMPPGYAKVRSYLTGAALRYGSQDYKVLFIREWRRFVEQDVRLVTREDGSYTFEVAVKDPETGEWTTQEGEIPAKTIVTTSAEGLPSAQMLRRCWLLSVDESQELTVLINKRKAEHRAGKVEPTPLNEIAIIQRAIELLQPCDVVIPYAELLIDLAPWDRTRLDYFLDVISVIAWVHQYQRGRDSQGRIVATPADLYVAMRICWPTLMQSLMQLPERLKKCWEVLPDDLDGEGVTTKDVALKLGLSQSRVRAYLADLVNLNYAVAERKPQSKERQYWRVIPQALKCSSAHFPLSTSKWQEIASFVEKALKNGSSGSAQSLTRVPSLLTACDPITGEEVQLPSVEGSSPPFEGGEGTRLLQRPYPCEQLSASSKLGEKSPDFQKRRKSRPSDVLNGKRAVEHLGEEAVEGERMGENVASIATFKWRRIPPAEPCPQCGSFPVEYEVIDSSGTILRKCPNCFEGMRSSYRNATWVELKLDEGEGFVDD